MSLRTLSGIQATGVPHIGNYYGAIRHWASSADASSYFMVADLHALTIPRDPADLLRSRQLTFASLLACGLEDTPAIVFMQSDVPEHAQLQWLLGGVARLGELRRMTQFKSKSGSEQESAVLDLFAYPVLQAADILLYRPNVVPVGDDQVQHVELARDIATRFNRLFGEVFVVPNVAVPTFGARIMDLQTPTSKMSKSAKTEGGVVYLTDSDDVIRKKIKRAVTDTLGHVAYDPVNRPAVSNLVEIFAAAHSIDLDKAVQMLEGQSYGALKSELTDVLISEITPIRDRITSLMDEESHLRALADEYATLARAEASVVYQHARKSMGLL